MGREYVSRKKLKPVGKKKQNPGIDYVSETELNAVEKKYYQNMCREYVSETELNTTGKKEQNLGIEYVSEADLNVMIRL